MHAMQGHSCAMSDCTDASNYNFSVAGFASHLVVQTPCSRSCISMRRVNWDECQELRRTIHLFQDQVSGASVVRSCSQCLSSNRPLQ